MQRSGKILICGYKGLVGSAILNTLKSKGYENLLLVDRDDIDFRRQNETEKLFDSEKPDYVFLAAAKVGGIIANNTYKAEFIYDNMAIALNIINSAKNSGVKKLLNLGSSCIYPKLAPQPMKEEHLLTGILEPTNEPYAIAKISAIKLCRYYNEQYGTNFISVMPTNLYGANDNYNLETSHVLPALVRKAMLGKALMSKDFDFIVNDLKRQPLGFDININFDDNQSLINALSKVGITDSDIMIWGTGNVMREFLHVDDMADACVYLMEKSDYNEIGEFINIGTGKDITIKELSQLIMDIAGYKGTLRFDTGKPDGTPKKLLDISKLSSLGWKAKISLEDGVNMVINHYKSL